MSRKKQIRAAFRRAVFTRDGWKCVCCGAAGKCRQTGEYEGAEVPRVDLDAHHVTDRNEMPHGGYVAENGISVCDACHELAEVFHSTGTAHPGFSPEELYARIGSSHTEALNASEKLGDG